MSALPRPSGVDLGMGPVDLGPPRPTRPLQVPGPSARVGTERPVAIKRVTLELGQRDPAYRETTVPGASDRTKGKTPGPGQGTGRVSADQGCHRNAKRLLVYVVDVAATYRKTRSSSTWRGASAATGEWGPSRPWYYAPHALTSSTTPKIV